MEAATSLSRRFVRAFFSRASCLAYRALALFLNLHEASSLLRCTLLFLSERGP